MVLEDHLATGSSLSNGDLPSLMLSVSLIPPSPLTILRLSFVFLTSLLLLTPVLELLVPNAKPVTLPYPDSASVP